MELEESLESYTRGVELLKSLRTRLSDAEQKVSVLLKDVDGNDVLADGEAASQSACDAGVDDRAGCEPVDEHLRAACRADLADAAPDEHDLPAPARSPVRAAQAPR